MSSDAGDSGPIDDILDDTIDAPVDAVDARSDADDGSSDTVDTSRNACGGSGELTFEGSAAVPGDVCGDGDSGELVCDGREALRCADDGIDLNACGTPGELPVVIGDACGVCRDGVYGCDDDGDATCFDATAENSCGGCTALGGAPGETCELGEVNGAWACSGTETVTCVAADLNACGGSSVLEFEGGAAGPGDACDTICGDGVLRCDGTEFLECVAAGDTLPANACGGCGVLPGVQGASCGECGGGVWACSDIGDMSCEGARALDACGGCGDLSAETGAVCGTCRLWGCAGSTLVCESTTEGEGCGETPDAPDAPIGVTATGGTYVDRVEVSWSPVTDATGYLVFRGGAPITPAPVTATTYADSGAPAGGGLEAPSGVSATTDRTDGIRITWSDITPSVGATARYTVVAVNGGAESPHSAPASGFRGAPVITGYEVLVRGAWTEATGLGYSDTEAPAATLALTGASATTTREDGVQLSVNAVTVADGTTQSYRVRSVTSAGNGAESTTATGRRTAGTVGYSWERASSEEGPYAGLPGASTRTHLDTTAAAGVTYAYRASAFAAGTDGATSATVTGRRLGSCDELDCAARNRLCTTEGGIPQCGDCVGGYGDCNEDLEADGCEAPLNTLSNCGGCGDVCARDGAGETCEDGVCEYTTCEEPYGDCDEIERNGCEESLTTLVDCGGCGLSCELDHASATCSTGSCAIVECLDDYEDCDRDPATGCEADLRSDDHCGVCGNTCGEAFVCQDGGCVRVPNVQIEADSSTACTIQPSGTAWCWGNIGPLNFDRDLWSGIRATPMEVPGVENVVEVALNAEGLENDAAYGCGLIAFRTAGGEVYLSGRNDVYFVTPLLGVPHGCLTEQPPVRIPGLDSVSDVALGVGLLCVVEEGTVRCAGHNFAGGLGDGSMDHSYDEFVDVVGISDATAIEASHSTVCAILADRSLRCWGANDAGQLGDEGEIYPGSPTPIVVPEVTDTVRVAPGDRAVCALDSSGTVRCWGTIPDMGLDKAAPTIVFEGATNLDAGDSGFCATSSVDDRAYCWGIDWYGRFAGDQSSEITYHLGPERMELLWDGEAADRIFDVAVAGSATCVVRGPDGGVWCAGFGAVTADGQGYNPALELLPSDRWRLYPVVPFADRVSEDGLCRDSIDNDGDGATDLDDSDCSTALGVGYGSFDAEVSPRFSGIYAVELDNACIRGSEPPTLEHYRAFRRVSWTAAEDGNVAMAVSCRGGGARRSQWFVERADGALVRCGSAPGAFSVAAGETVYVGVALQQEYLTDVGTVDCTFEFVTADAL